MTFNEIIRARLDRNEYLSQGKGTPENGFWDGYHTGWKEAYQDLKEILEQRGFDMDMQVVTDVVEVVRCGQCKNRDKNGVCEKFRQRYPFFPEDDFYCGFGEKGVIEVDNDTM